MLPGVRQIKLQAAWAWRRLIYLFSPLN